MAKQRDLSGQKVASVLSHGTFVSRESEKRSISSHSNNLRYQSFLGSSEKFLAHVPSVTYQCDSRLTVSVISPNALELIGVPAEELLGRRDLWGDRLYAEDRVHLISRLGQLELGETASATHRIIDACGLPVWVSHSFKKVQAGSDEMVCGCFVPLPTALCTQAVDTTIISQFVHKMGNHFQLINLLMGTLRRCGIADADIDSLQEAVDKSVEFTRTFLNFAQSVSGQSEFTLGQVFRTAMQSSSPAFTDKKVLLKDRVGELFNSILVRGDPILLEIALASILQNALEATKSPGEVVVSGKCERHQSVSRLTAQIVIADTGCGMDKDELRRAATPFFTSRQERDGLGLSMAVRIIEQHGGALQISSTLRQGTEVVVALPVSVPRKVPAVSE